MLFITNRMPKQSARSRAGRRIDFDYKNTDVSKWLYFCERHGVDEYQEIMSDAFFSRLKHLPDSSQLLFYIHGFNCNMEPDVFSQAETLEALLNSDGRQRVCVIPLIWPCDDDAPLQILDDYWDDQRSADFSGIAFSRLLDMFDEWRHAPEQQAKPCLRRMNVLAHSMGNRVLVNTLHYWVDFHGYGGMPMLFRNVFMIAADVNNRVLERGHKGEYVPDSAKNVVIYYASDDWAMSASKVANLKNRIASRRLGMTGPAQPQLLPSQRVFSIDCDAFNSRFDSKGHTYFLTNAQGEVSPIIEHMAGILDRGIVAPAFWLPHEMENQASANTTDE